jgi:hypothetical protein
MPEISSGTRKPLKETSIVERSLASLVVAALSLLLLPSAALAAGMSFCTTGASNCQKIKVLSEAEVVITKVKVTQLAGANNCPTLEKVHSANMGMLDSFKVETRVDCPYQVRFSTTFACLGDKQGKFGLSDRAAGKAVVALTGPCGGLKVRIEKQ